jgi:putative acetyltransferase
MHLFVIKLDDLLGEEIVELLEEHLDDMRATSPPDSIHALDLTRLKNPSIKFWTIWQGKTLAGCGAIKKLDSTHGEIKSMRTANNFQKNGIGSALLIHLINEAKFMGYQKLSLETGTMDFFKPAHRLYTKYGFTDCEPFGDYGEDPYSKFMVLNLVNKVKIKHKL